jgi:hypothetical protein
MRVKRFRLLFLCCGIFIQSQDAFSQASVVAGSVATTKTAYAVGEGNNRIIVVAVTQEQGGPPRTVTSITWGGQSLTLARAQSSGGILRSEVWYLNEAGISAARGSCSYNFIVTWSAAPTNEVFAAMTIKDVDQTTPIANVNSTEQNNTQTRNTGNIAVGINDLLMYASSSNSDRTHTPPATYTEQTEQTIGGAGGTSMATATKEITVAATEDPTATWPAANSRLINVGVGFNGVAVTSVRTFYSRASGAWDANTSWSFSSDGTSGAVPAGVWPRRTDNVVIQSTHTITVNATDDNKSCGFSPDGLGRSNVGAFTNSATPMFYHTGDILIANGGTLTATVPMMLEGYTLIENNGTFTISDDIVNLGYLEVAASGNFSNTDDLILSGNSNTVINSLALGADDIYIDHTNARLCGTGIMNLGNGGADPTVQLFNSATLAQICSTFTITCTSNCTAFPITPTGNFFTGNAGPAGVGNATNNRLWLMADRGTFSDNGATVAVDLATIQQWNDQSGNSNNALQNTAGNRPIYRTGQDNALPALQFTGNLFIDAPAPGIAPTSSYTYLMVFKDTETGLGAINDGNGHFILDRTTATNELVSLKPVTGSFYGFQKRNNAGGGLGGALSTTVINTNTKWVEMVRNRNTNYRLYYNGTQESSIADADGNLTPPAPRIGRHATNNNGGIRGFIHEFIIYAGLLNNAQRILINNYVSAKYALTLSADDVYTMDNAGNGNYDFEVAGIGQASDGSNHIDAKGIGVARMWNPNNLGNGEFLMWGHDNAAITSTTTAVGTAVDGTIIQERLTRIWRISEVGEVGTVSISFDFSGVGGSPLGSNLRLLIDRDGDGFADNDITPIVGSVSNGIAVFSNVNFQNGDRFTLGNTNLLIPLPIELISFTAQAVKAEVKLKWSTATELNNHFFTIQRSQNAEAWEDIIEVKGAGNSIERIDYETTDGMPYNGVSYYRLKQTDFDKQFSYSEVRRIEVTETIQLKVFPNPSTGTFRIVTGFKILPEDVKFSNLLGQRISINIQEGDSSLLAESSSLDPGIYILQVSKGNWRQSVRVVIE